jgi:long-chain acyl-CoA synthetase
MGKSMNLDAVFQVAATSFKQCPAILSQDGGCRLSYQDLDHAIESTCRELKMAGLKPGSCIAVHYPSGIEYILFTYAVWRAGACVVPVPIDASRAEKLRIFNEIGIDGIVCGPGTVLDLDLPAASAVHVIEGRYEFALLTPCRPHPAGFSDINTAFLRFSSGTTGVAKGVILSHETILARMEAANVMLRIVPGDKVVWLLSMAYHFAVTIVAYLSYGAAIVICRDQGGATIIEAARRNRASMIYGAPLHFESMLQACPEPLPLASIRLAIATTAAMRPRLSMRFRQKFGIPINCALGIIEVGLPCVDTEPNDLREGGVGRPFPAYALELRPVLPGNEHREILLRGPGLLDAYYHPFTRRETLMPDGWFPTGDLGELDADGRLYVLGRIKEVINIGGMKVLPAEIESVLNAHPHVVESCAYPHSHPVRGEVPYVSIVLAPGAVAGSAAEQVLAQYCMRSLPAYAIPDQFNFVDCLPRTPSGKLIRREIAHLSQPAATQDAHSRPAHLCGRETM